MAIMSDLIVNFAKAVATDVKGLLAKFDANGKLLKVNLPALSKADVGLGNVDNTADSAKVVASAGKLKTPRSIGLTGGVTGSASFDGSSSISIGATLNEAGIYKAINTKTSDNTPATKIQDFEAGSKYHIFNATDAPTDAYGFPVPLVVETYVSSYDGNDITQVAVSMFADIDPFSGGQQLGFLWRRFNRSQTPTADQLKWKPLSASTLTYRDTTTEFANVYVGSDGVLKRSTASVKAPIVLTAKLGNPTDGNLKTFVPHGVDSASIKSVNVRVLSTDGYYYWQNSIDGGMYSTGSANMSYYNHFTIFMNTSSVVIMTHKDANRIHNRTATIFIETI